MPCTLKDPEELQGIIILIFSAGSGRRDIVRSTPLSDFGWSDGAYFGYWTAIRATVNARGCDLHFGPAQFASLGTVGEVVDLVWEDVSGDP